MNPDGAADVHATSPFDDQRDSNDMLEAPRPPPTPQDASASSTFQSIFAHRQGETTDDLDNELWAADDMDSIELTPDKRSRVRSVESPNDRQAINKWADNEEDEDVFNDALQERVNELTLGGFAMHSIDSELDDVELVQDVAPPETLLTVEKPWKGSKEEPTSYKPGHDQTSDLVKMPDKRRAQSTNFVARNIKAVEGKKGAIKAASSPRSSPRSPSSLDAKSSPMVRSKADVSDVESVRRYITNDLKQISVDRLVSDAKRLQFLEQFYRRYQAQQAAAAEKMAATT